MTKTGMKSNRVNFISVNTFYNRRLHETGTKIAPTSLKSCRSLDRRIQLAFC